MKRLRLSRGSGLRPGEKEKKRLEWDCYLNAWASHVPLGMNSIHPQKLLTVLDSVKRSLEPVGAWALHPTMSALQGFDSHKAVNPLYYNSMFEVQRPSLLRTADILVVMFCGGSTTVNFEQFRMMMEFLKEQKSKFVAFDFGRSGSIDMNELATFFAERPRYTLIEVMRCYDQDCSGSLEFDEFVQTMAETNFSC